MTEDFLHYLWRFRLFSPPLKTVTGEILTILHPGEYNRDAGPDFTNARVRIGTVIWAGNVEIHLRASDWYRHLHQQDQAYRNVILHVVGTYDAEVTGAGDKPVPVMEVKDCYPLHLQRKFERLLATKQFIPCSNLFDGTHGETFPLWAPALAMERVRERSSLLLQLLRYASGDWEETFYQAVAGALGGKINRQPFELLAKSLPLKRICRYSSSPSTIEAFLFGQAGLLDSRYQEPYPMDLRETYRFYQDKHSLTPLEKGIWKFFRIRPSNFPTIRISQFAALIAKQDSPFQSVMVNRNFADCREHFQVQASEYWNTHYTFDRISGNQVKVLGGMTLYLILINAVVPSLFLYGEQKNLPTSREQALSLLEEIPGEKSSLVSAWQEMGMPASNALQTQALKQLKTSYCDRKRCLECRIGARLLR